MPDAKSILLFLVFTHGVYVLVHGWNHKPRLANPEPRIRSRVLWLLAVVLWMTLHAASPAYYGAELVEHIGKTSAHQGVKRTPIEEVARAAPAAEAERPRWADFPPSSLQQTCAQSPIWRTEWTLVGSRNGLWRMSPTYASSSRRDG